MIRAALRMLRWLPNALNRLHLEYARDHLTKWDPTHKALPEIVLELNELEARKS